jgi:hypothetical protein
VANKRRGPWVPFVIWGVCFTIAQVLQVGWENAMALSLAAAAGGTVLALIVQRVRGRREQRRQQQHPYWLP